MESAGYHLIIPIVAIIVRDPGYHLITAIILRGPGYHLIILIVAVGGAECYDEIGYRLIVLIVGGDVECVLHRFEGEDMFMNPVRDFPYPCV